MPGGDGTGPVGFGPRTSRSAGFCAGFSGPGYINSNPGRGFGRGFWRRRMFWCRPYYQNYYNPGFRGVFTEQNKEMEKSYLEDMVKDLEKEIKEIRERIKEVSEEK